MTALDKSQAPAQQCTNTSCRCAMMFVFQVRCTEHPAAEYVYVMYVYMQCEAGATNDPPNLLHRAHAHKLGGHVRVLDGLLEGQPAEADAPLGAALGSLAAGILQLLRRWVPIKGPLSYMCLT